ncbi:MAG: GAF domain-containing protein [Cyanobacteria bacterium J06592_8]
MKSETNNSSSIKTINEQYLLYRIIKRISQSLELDDILTATTAEVRAFLQTDRVMIYQFSADGSGQVMAESIYENHLPSLKGLHFPADDIPPAAREMFSTLGQRSIVNVATGQIGWSPNPRNGTESFSETVEINYRSVDPCHIAYLKAMGVQSSFVIPIFHQDGLDSNHQLWGLLVSHHAEPWEISASQFQLVQLIVDQLSTAITQSTLLQYTRQQAKREATINQVTSLLHQQPDIKLQAALEVTVQALQGIGGRLYICASEEQASEIWTSGEQPIIPEWESSSILEEHPLWQDWIKTRFYQPQDLSINSPIHPGIWAIHDLYKDPLFRVLVSGFHSTKIRGLLIIPIQYRQKALATLTIFRNEIDTTTLWAGCLDLDVKQNLPRQSFEVWQELKIGQSQPWQEDDLTLANALGQQFSMAIQQYLVYAQVQNTNIGLEQKVEKYINQLRKTLQFTKTVERVSSQIRKTLDLQTVLLTIVQEVRVLIQADRVLIYKLVNKRIGEVIVESTGENIPSILGIKTPEGCFPSHCINRYRQGKFGAMNDINEAYLPDCYQAFLNQIQVQANLVVPIGANGELWGLLIAHECHQPRNWQTKEIDILSQLAEQAAIAINQAELYEKACNAAEKEKAKAEQLSQTLEELHQAQAQLIQTEKMSSLGRLVAGIAHEINNPVSFIYGNLSHAHQYSQDLLHLLELYQTYSREVPEEVQDYIESIDLDFMTSDLPQIFSSMQVGAERIRELILSLRNFSRLDESKIKAVNLHEGLENTLMILQHRLQGNSNFPNIQVIKSYGDLPLIECDASLLNQVFMNLITNAIDALQLSYNQFKKQDLSTRDYHPSIWIETSITQINSSGVNWVKISILDNGVGIKNKDIPHIFDPFFTTKPVGQGTGLGLSISYQIIVDKHHGSLQCIPQLEGKTAFIISIPIHQQ